MRILGGDLKGRNIVAPKDLPVRPTTSFATEALFNILANRFDVRSLKVLDLFSGTGHISIEFGSRGCKNITAVDDNMKCVAFLKRTAESFELPIHTIKSDVFKFLKNTKGQTFDLIFADPPYELENIEEISALVMNQNLLSPEGLLIVEHSEKTKLQDSANFAEHRRYGNVNFSFFKPKQNNL